MKSPVHDVLHLVCKVLLLDDVSYLKLFLELFDLKLHSLMIIILLLLFLPQQLISLLQLINLAGLLNQTLLKLICL